MSFAVLLLGLLPQAADDRPAADAVPPAFVEVLLPKADCYVGQVVPLGIHFGFESSFLDQELIQLYRRPLDLPVQLAVPWLEADDDAWSAALADDAGAGLRLALNDGLASAAPSGDFLIDGQVFRGFTLRCELIATAAGELVLPGTELRFASATRFVDDLVQGRVPADRIDGRVAAAATTLPILPLPEAGRPAAFSGGVGRFRLAATVAEQELETGQGQGFELELRISGEGDLSAIEPPALDGLDGFHVYGRIEQPADGERVFRYELAPLHSGVDRLPPIELSFFDPSPPAGYRRVATEVIPLPVSGPVGPPVPSMGSVGDPGATPDPGVLSKFLLVALFLGPVAVVGLVFLGWQRRNRRSGLPETDPGPPPLPARPAASAAGSEPSSTAAATEDPLGAVLAAHLGCPPAAVLGPELAARLEAAGLPADLARRCAALHEACVAVRYGAPDAPGLEGELRELMAQLEALPARLPAQPRGEGQPTA